MSKGRAAHGDNPAGIFVQTNTVAADQEATRETPGTAEKRSTGLFPSGIFIHLYTECLESYGFLTCIYAVTSYVECVWGMRQFLLSTGGEHDDGHSLYRRDPALFRTDVAVRQTL